MGSKVSIILAMFAAGLLTACGSGGGSSLPDVQPADLAVALRSMQQLSLPAGADETVFESMRQEALNILQENADSSGRLPVPAFPAGDQLQLQHDGSTFRWLYRLSADADRNGVVNAADLAAIAAGSGSEGPFNPGSLNFALDGNGDGYVDQTDAMLVANRYGEGISGFRIYRSSNAADYPSDGLANGPGTELLGSITLAEAGLDADGYMQYAASADQGYIYWLRPVLYSGEAAPSTPLAAQPPLSLTNDPAGHNSCPYPVPANPGLHWANLNGEPLGGRLALSGNQRIYEGSESGVLRAYGNDGGLLWQYESGAEISSDPVVDSDGSILFGNHAGEFYRISPEGTLQWSSQLGGRLSTPALLSTDGNIYVGNSEGSLFALSADGTLKWTHAAQDHLLGRPALTPADDILLGDYSGRLELLSPAGHLIWFHYLYGNIVTDLAVAADGTIYVAGPQNKLHAINSDGGKLWTYEIGYVNRRLILGDSGRIYCTTEDDTLVALNNDGTLIWELPLSGDSDLICQGSDGVLLAWQYDKLLAVSNTGELLWKYRYPVMRGLNPNNDGFHELPLLGANGVIYCKSSYGNLMAI